VLKNASGSQRFLFELNKFWAGRHKEGIMKKKLATNAGAPVADDQNIKTAGPRRRSRSATSATD
jgi:hypothetical protein